MPHEALLRAEGKPLLEFRVFVGCKYSVYFFLWFDVVWLRLLVDMDVYTST